MQHPAGIVRDDGGDEVSEGPGAREVPANVGGEEPREFSVIVLCDQQKFVFGWTPDHWQIVVQAGR
jgi:hypothetical protein